LTRLFSNDHTAVGLLSVRNLNLRPNVDSSVVITTVLDSDGGTMLLLCDLQASRANLRGLSQYSLLLEVLASRRFRATVSSEDSTDQSIGPLRTVTLDATGSWEGCREGQPVNKSRPAGACKHAGTDAAGGTKRVIFYHTRRLCADDCHATRVPASDHGQEARDRRCVPGDVRSQRVIKRSVRATRVPRFILRHETRRLSGRR
jgi:hypothetical protein